MEDLQSASRARNWRLSCRTCTLHKELHTSLNTSSAASLGRKYMLPWMSPVRPWQKYTHLFRNLANSPLVRNCGLPAKLLRRCYTPGHKPHQEGSAGFPAGPWQNIARIAKSFPENISSVVKVSSCFYLNCHYYYCHYCYCHYCHY